MLKVRETNTSSTFIRIKEYVFACINLYGVITLDDFISVYHRYEGTLLNKEEVIPVLELLDSIDEINVSFCDNILANGYFIPQSSDDFIEAKAMLKLQGDKPRYLPENEEFLRYMDPTYIEPTEAMKEFEVFLTKHGMNPKRSAEDIKLDVLEFRDEIVFGEQLSHYVDYLNKAGYVFNGEIQMIAFAAVAKDMNNETRIYENKGFTPTELKDLSEPSNGYIQ